MDVHVTSLTLSCFLVLTSNYSVAVRWCSEPRPHVQLSCCCHSLWQRTQQRALYQHCQEPRFLVAFRWWHGWCKYQCEKCNSLFVILWNSYGHYLPQKFILRQFKTSIQIHCIWKKVKEVAIYHDYYVDFYYLILKLKTKWKYQTSLFEYSKKK